MWLGNVPDHSCLWSFVDGLLVQRFCAHKPVLAVHVRVAFQCLAGSGFPVACLDGEFIGALAVINDRVEPGSYHFFRQT